MGVQPLELRSTDVIETYRNLRRLHRVDTARMFSLAKESGTGRGGHSFRIKGCPSDRLAEIFLPYESAKSLTFYPRKMWRVTECI